MLTKYFSVLWLWEKKKPTKQSHFVNINIAQQTPGSLTFVWGSSLSLPIYKDLSFLVCRSWRNGLVYVCKKMSKFSFQRFPDSTGDTDNQLIVSLTFWPLVVLLVKSKWRCKTKKMAERSCTVCTVMEVQRTISARMLQFQITFVCCIATHWPNIQTKQKKTFTSQ